MSGLYWIKLWIEILDDPKMATLPDRLWRRTIELFLCAGRMGRNGALPESSQIAWMLRTTTDDLELDLKQLALTGIIQRTETGWMVTKFANRQAAIPDAERQRQHRDTKKKQQYYDTVTNQSQNVTQSRAEENQIQSRAEADTDNGYHLTPVGILSKASGLSAFPADQVQWAEVIASLTEDYGEEKTIAAMRQACQQWISTKGQSGRYYNITNLGWINWAQRELVEGIIPAVPKDTNQMTDAEFRAYLAQKGATDG